MRTNFNHTYRTLLKVQEAGRWQFGYLEKTNTTGFIGNNSLYCLNAVTWWSSEIVGEIYDGQHLLQRALQMKIAELLHFLPQ